MRSLKLALAALFVALLLTPAAARADVDFDNCAKKSGDEALRACTAFLARGGSETAKNRAIVYNNRAIEYSLQSIWDRSIADSTAAIRLDPRFASAYVNRGHVYERTGEYDKGLADYNEAIRLDAKYHLSFYNRGIIWKKKGEVDKAIADYTVAIRLNPKYVNAFSQRGLAYEDQKKYPLALSDYRAALALKPGDQSAIADVERVDKLLAAPAAAATDQDLDGCSKKSGNDAIAACTAFLARGDSESAHNRAIVYSNRGIAYSTQSKWAEAIADSSAAIKLEPTFANAYINRGHVYERTGEYDKGLADYNEAIRLDSKYDLSFYNRGIILKKKGEVDKAIADYTAAIRLNPKYVNAFSQRGLAYEEQKKYALALSDFRAALALKPGDQSAIADVERADKLAAAPAAPVAADTDLDWDGCSKKSGNDAIAACTAFLARGDTETAHNRAVIYNNRGIEYSTQSKWAEAIADSTAAIRLDPNFASAYVNRGHVYERQGDYDKGLADYNQAIRLDDKYYLSFFNRGIIWKKKGDVDKAIADYTAAIRLNPKYAGAFSQRGLAYEDQNKLALAQSDFRAALALKPGDKFAMADLERVDKLVAAPAAPQPAQAPVDQVWIDCGKKSGDELIKACTTFLARGSSEAAKDRSIAYYNRGVEYKTKGDARQAVADYAEAIKLNPTYQFAWNNRGTAYAALEDYPNAIANYSEAMRLDPKDADPIGNRGLAYEKQGNLKQALEDFRAAVALRSNDKIGTGGVERVGKLLAPPPVAPAGNQVADKDWETCTKKSGEEAIAACSAYLARGSAETDRNRSLILASRGVEYKGRGEVAKALADYNEAIRLDAKNYYAFFNRGVAYRIQGELDKALADYSEAIKINPKSADAFGSRAFVYEQQGQAKLALEDFRAAIALRPGDRVGIEGEERMTKRLAAVNAPGPGPAAAAGGSCPGGQKRVALVVGNSAYPGAARLANPGNDAEDVAALLQDQLCFKVIFARDANYQVFSKKIGEFADLASGADVALFYYAGHGMQLGGTNLLMPVDATLQNEYDALHGNVSAQDLVALLEARAKVTLVFLDACRNNPMENEFRGRLTASAGRGFGDARGLAPMTKQSGETLVVYATRPNDQASDGTGRNSPFTEAFLKLMITPDKDIELVLRDVSASVRASTGGKQVPQRLTQLEHGLVLLPAR